VLKYSTVLSENNNNKLSGDSGHPAAEVHPGEGDILLYCFLLQSISVLRKKYSHFETQTVIV